MRNLPLLMAMASLTFMSAAFAQVQTYTTSFDITQSAGGPNVHLPKFTGSLANLKSINLLLDVTSISFTENVSGTGGTPSMTVQDAVSAGGIPTTLDFDTSFTAPGKLKLNANANYTFNSATGTVFTNLPAFAIGSITSNFANYQGSSGTWSDPISSDITLMYANGTFRTPSNVSVKGTLEVFYNEPAEIPEPSSWALMLASLGGLLVLRRIRVRA